MYRLGLQNFKKFEMTPELRLGKVNFLVGKNNAGKSTIFKAIQTIDSIITTCWSDGREGVFSIPQDKIKRCDYSKLLYNKATDKTITFSYSFSSFYGSQKHVIKIEPVENSALKGQIQYAKIVDYCTGIDLTIDFEKNKATFVFSKNEYDEPNRQMIVDAKARNHYDSFYQEIERKIVTKEIRLEFDSLKERRTFFNFDDISESCDILQYLGFVKDISFDCIEQLKHFQSNSKYFSGLASLLKDVYFKCLHSKGDEIEQAKVETLVNYRDKFEFLCEHVSSLSFTTGECHIPTYNIQAKAIYDKCDKNDMFANILSSFDSSDCRQIEFIEKWMHEFEIGESFRIETIEDQLYKVLIKNEDGIEENLAEKGTGSIRMMALLFRIANLMDFHHAGLGLNPYSLMIEEPEQNLHPALQSKLADFFEEVASKVHIKFIIETHSEYLIRRSQVLVAKKQYKSIEETAQKSPFVTYYFPENGVPYEMQYQPSGRFFNDFGAGFFDIASDLAFELF